MNIGILPVLILHNLMLHILSTNHCFNVVCKAQGLYRSHTEKSYFVALLVDNKVFERHIVLKIMMQVFNKVLVLLRSLIHLLLLLTANCLFAILIYWITSFLPIFIKYQ